MDKTTAKYICLAQLCSHEAKKKYTELNNMAYAQGEHIPYGQYMSLYDCKDAYIQYAISRIIRKRNTGFSFYVTRDTNINSYLIYFDFTLKGKRRQVSFHSFKDWSKYCLYRNSNKAKQKHFNCWDKGNSEMTCCNLAREMGLFEE